MRPMPTGLLHRSGSLSQWATWKWCGSCWRQAQTRTNRAQTELLRPFLAAQIGDPEILAAVTDSGGQATKTASSDAEVLADALAHRNVAMLRALLEGGVDPDTQIPSSTYVDANADGARDLWLVPAIQEAITRDQPEAVQALLNAGADPNATGLIYLLEGDEGDRQESWAALFGIAEDPNVESGPYGDTPLHDAIFRRSSELVKILLRGGADTERRNQRGETALIAAIDDGDTETVRLPLEAGANLNVTDKFGDSPLEMTMLGERVSDRPMYELLKEAYGQAGIDGDPLEVSLEVQDLYDAISSGEAAIVQVQVNAGADVNAKYSDGRSMLEWAIMRGGVQGYPEIVRILVHAGADVNAEAVASNSLLQLATMYGNSETVRILTDAGMGN